MTTPPPELRPNRFVVRLEDLQVLDLDQVVIVQEDDPKLDRAIGAFLGLFVGDALGAPVEFQEPGRFEPVRDYRAGGTWGLQAGQWTDDGSMALCLAEALQHDPGPDPHDLMARFRRWWREGENSATGHCFDIGTGTALALERFERTGNPLAGLPEGRGNGTVMRLAPVALRWWRDPEAAARCATLQARCTHGAEDAVAGTALLARQLVAAIGGKDWRAQGPRAGDPPELVAAWEAAWQDRTPPNGGLCTSTLQAAWWAVRTTSGFEQAVLRAVNLGGDADTIGAVAGQLAGAVHGEDGIPAHWRSGLWEAARLRGIAERLYAAA